MPVYVQEFIVALPRDLEEPVYLTLPRYTRVIDGSLMLGDEPGTAVFHGYVEHVPDGQLSAATSEMRRYPFYWRRPGQLLGPRAFQDGCWVGTIAGPDGRLLLFLGRLRAMDHGNAPQSE